MAIVKNVKISGVEMNYCRFGQGDKTLVILPGISVLEVNSAAEAIEKQYEKLTKQYTIYLFDRRANVPAGYTIEQMADDTVLCIRAIGLMIFDLLGVSQGGMIALEIAKKYPEKVKKLVLVSTCAAATKKLQNVADSWIELADSGNIKELQEAFVDPMYGEETLKKCRQSLLSADPGYTQEDLNRFRILAESLQEFNLKENLDKIRAKTLLIGCEGDKIIGPEGIEELHELLPSEMYLYPKKYGHAVYDEAPDFTERLKTFLED